MPTEHIVTDCESTSSIAEKYGFFPYAIWNYPENAELKSKRQHMNILLPGDKLIIPDKEIREVDGETDKKHTFIKLGTPALFRLQLYDDGKPRSNQDYILVADNNRYSGTTDEDGVLTEYVSPLVKSGKIILMPSELSFELKFNALSPIDVPVGIRQRLENLGFLRGGESEEDMSDAVFRFQKKCALEPTGQLDQVTRKKLFELHDSVSDFPGQENTDNESN